LLAFSELFKVCVIGQLLALAVLRIDVVDHRLAAGRQKLKVRKDAFELLALKVGADLLVLFNKNTCCKLNIESIIYSSSDVLLPFVLWFSVCLLSVVLTTFATEQTVGIIFVWFISEEQLAILVQGGYDLVSNICVGCGLILDYLLHHLEAKIFQTR
jgi:hypothetical protein